GAGPRATPTFATGVLYCYTGKGVLIALQAATGDLIWRRDLMEEVKAPLPIWGFSSSPAVFGDVVIVFACGEGENGLMAFDRLSGDLRWAVSAGGMNFASAQRAVLDGQETLVFVQDDLARGFDPATGEPWWQYATNPKGSPPIVQPQQITETDLIIPLGDGVGVSRVSVSLGDDGDWTVTEKWRSRNLKPSFNDYLIVDEAIFGFDKSIFACVDATDGSRIWKRGRYGFGQALLLESSAQLIVTTETGDLVLLDADREKLVERGRVSALEGKTWNHPVVADGRLFVRNAQEMACYRLTVE
ncbi:MAG: PQQ-binding-like beta-propeller repeat protein, partial [Planctomycetota bacterium]